MERALGMVSVEVPGCRFRKVFVPERGRGEALWSLCLTSLWEGFWAATDRSACPEGVLESQLSSSVPLSSSSFSQAGWCHLCTCTEKYVLSGKSDEVDLHHLWQGMQSDPLRMQCEFCCCLFRCRTRRAKGPGVKPVPYLWFWYSWITNSNFHLC